MPHVLAAAPTVLVTEWLEGRSLSTVIADGTQEERDHCRHALPALPASPARRAPACCTPTRTRATTASCPTAGSASSTSARWPGCPTGRPPAIGQLLRIASPGDADAVVEGLRAEGFIKPGVEIDAERPPAYLAPVRRAGRARVLPLHPRLDARALHPRVNDPRNPDFSAGFKINLPPEYMLIHRVWLGGIGVLSQMDATVPMRGELERWLPPSWLRRTGDADRDRPATAPGSGTAPVRRRCDCPPALSDRVPAWTLAVVSMLSVQLGAALSTRLFDTVGAGGTRGCV